MLELLKSGGWLMIPIIACSIVAAGIAIERAWTLRRQTVAPRHLLADVLVQIEGKVKLQKI